MKKLIIIAFLILMISLVEAIDVSNCGTLSTANTVYNQIANISNVINPCMTISAPNITYNGNGNWINGSTSNYAIYSNQHNTTINNADIRDAQMYFSGSFVTLNNIKTNKCGKNVVPYTSYIPCVAFYANNNIISNSNFNDTAADFLKFSGSSNNTIRNSIFSFTSHYMMFEFGASFNNTLLNVTYLSPTEEWGQECVRGFSQPYEDGSYIFRDWYFDAQVNYSHNNTPVSGANVSIWNSTGSLVFSALTDSNGRIPIQQLNQYKKIATVTCGNKYYQSPYTVNTTFQGWNINKPNNYSTNLNISKVHQLWISDAITPNLTLIFPKNLDSYSYNESINLNYSVADTPLGINSCWYFISNSSGLVIPSTIIANCLNTTFSLPRDGIYWLNFSTNDSAGNINLTSIKFGVSIYGPGVTLLSPIDNQWLSEANVTFNATAIDSDGVNFCELWGSWGSGWHKNETISLGNVTEASVSTSKNLSEGTYVWNFNCTDKIGYSSWAAENFTLDVDHSAPIINITSPINGSSLTGIAATINYNISDRNIDACFFTLRDSSGNVHNYGENTSLTCSENGSRTLIFLTGDIGNFTTFIYGRDKAGNENYNTVSFSTSGGVEAPPGGGGGGGGGKKPAETEVVALIAPEGLTKKYTDLERAIIYARVYEYVKKMNKKIETIELTTRQILAVRDIFKQNGIHVVDNDVNLWLKNFKSELVEVVKVKSDDAKKYNLINSNLVKVTPFTLEPKRISYIWLYKPCLGGDRDFKYAVKANKQISKCDRIDGVFKCEIKGDITAEVSYSQKIVLTENWAQNIWTGKIVYVSIANEIAYQDISVRAINLCYKSPYTLGMSFYLFIMIISGIMLAGGGGVLYWRKRRKALIER
jgi:hypothetical protein